MPVYRYRMKDGSIREKVFHMGRAPKRTKFSDGKTGKRDIVAEHKGFITTPGNWPMASDAMGVLPRQIPEAMAENERLGIRETSYTPDGRPELNSPGHFKEFAEAHKFYDRNGGYGSPQRK